MQEKPENIRNVFALKESGLEPGDRIHLAVDGPGQVTDEAIFLGEYTAQNYQVLCGGTSGIVSLGIKAKIEDNIVELPWTEIVELWPIHPKAKSASK